jgi:ABC-type antimicrobial peptide transport system permease subunit
VPYRAEGLVSMQARSIYIRDIELHVAGSPAGLEADVRRVLAGIDPNLTVISAIAFDEQLGRNFNQQRLIARLTALYGQLALLLAAVGLYGVTAHYVAKRTTEIGIRMALGADRRRVLTMVLRRALAQTAIGLALGIPAALLAGRALSSLLYDVTARDPLVINAAVLVLASSAIVAAIIPARRAASLDPIKALRGE